ncbi:uncharacterized protein LOC111714087 isoform X1 [Eurytemora carolleeae]|uniref:uncharacterized protein LOC111714087 isoform X1 n=1 Tax=Eurytemora carolleeae TaxID=1294199 RepID=UPI000C775C63|nr:uncharacterized protein LOC111714087 isoform X1 [Eurytemora carolleeae]XP_023344890.1 uncharacterized protein LOC111714087 isoform X1 [Eurytemora carolleeae]|eukprot:XP_023344889.1 uncharacterized protein LOC111714087 isoform X1 [Eurytemora affinis]
MFVSRVLGAATGGYLEGKGGRKMNNGTRMQGMTLASLRHHVALQPLFIIMGAGVTMVTAMCIRTATKTTDVNWRKIKEEDYAVNHYKAKQFKLLNPTGADLAKPSPIPDYKN